MNVIEAATKTVIAMLITDRMKKDFKLCPSWGELYSNFINEIW